MIRSNPSVEVFDRDAAIKGGYLYTSGGFLSSRLATRRQIDATLEMARFAGRRMLDVGCGDGSHTRCFVEGGRPQLMIGVDAACHAVVAANGAHQGQNTWYAVGDAHDLPFPDNSFDVVLLHGVLHHVDRPCEAIKEAFRVATEVVVLEPNGYNPGLKVLERVSPYHREHGERSYTSWQLRRWIEHCGGRVLEKRYAGFVPMFSPDWLARVMKALEPVVERLPLVNALGCAVVVLAAKRKLAVAASRAQCDLDRSRCKAREG